MVKSQTEECISKLKHNFKEPTGKVLQNADIKACIFDLHNKYVFVPTKTLIKELELDNCSTLTRSSPTLPVNCHLKKLSIPMILSRGLLVLSCLMMTRGYLTYI